jgi:hypothetical protein
MWQAHLVAEPQQGVVVELKHSRKRSSAATVFDTDRNVDLVEYDLVQC